MTYKDKGSYESILLMASLIDCSLFLKSTGWQRLIGSPKLQIIFHKRATKYRSLLRKMTYKETGSHESSPPCRVRKSWILPVLSCKRALKSQGILASLFCGKRARDLRKRALHTSHTSHDFSWFCLPCQKSPISPEKSPTYLTNHIAHTSYD